MNFSFKESCINCSSLKAPIINIYRITPFKDSRHHQDSAFIVRVATCDPLLPQAPCYDRFPNANRQITSPYETTCPGWQPRSR